MTNEMLAEAIKNKGKGELIPVLWKNICRLLFIKSDRIFYMMRERFSALGVENCDLHQECYFVFLQALDQYRPPYKFTTFLEFPFKAMIAEMLKKNKKAVIYTTCTDDVISEDGYNLTEIIPDPDSDIYRFSDIKSDREVIEMEINKLPEKQRKVILLYYFSELNDSEIAKILKIRPASVCQLRHRALARLKSSGILKKLCYHPNISYNSRQVLI